MATTKQAKGSMPASTINGVAHDGLTNGGGDDAKRKKKASDTRMALISMSVLAIQFGIQPILTRKFTPPGIHRSTVLLIQEIVKFVVAGTMLYLSGATKEALKGWNIRDWLYVACVPAALYAIQNLAALLAYQNLDALTVNVLNQTKTLSAALCCYLVMGRKQSKMQVLALHILLLAALVIEGIVKLEWFLQIPSLLFGNSSSSEDRKLSEEKVHWGATRHFTHGVAPILLASFISGLAGALSQKNLQGHGGRDAYLFTMELCAATVIFLTVSFIGTTDGNQIFERGFFHGWTPATFIPIVTNSIGGIVVGLVTKYAGSVRKGFALIFGILISGIVQAVLMPDMGVTKEQIMGGALAALSLYLHSAYPPQKSSDTKVAAAPKAKSE